MDVTPLLNAPWAQPLVALVVTALGAWLGSRGGKRNSAPTQSATSYGDNSPIAQDIVVRTSTWHVHPAPPRTPAPTAPPRPVNDEDTVGAMLTLWLGAVAVVCLLTVFWGVVSVALYAVVVVAIFVTALTWPRWPTGVAGRAWVAGLVVVGSSAVLWAIAALAKPVGGEPSLADIAAATAGQPLGDALPTAIRLLGGAGLTAYLYRLAGLIMLLLPLCWLVPKPLGLSLAETGSRSDPPRMWLVRLGNRVAGPQAVGPGFVAATVLLFVLGIALIHPGSVGWLLQRLGPHA